MTKKQANPRNEYVVFGVFFGILTLIGSIFCFQISSDAPRVMGLPRGMAFGLPLIVIATLFITSGVLVAKNNIAGVKLMIAAALLFLVADLSVEIGILGKIFAFKLLSLAIYAIPILVIMRSGKVIAAMKNGGNSPAAAANQRHGLRAQGSQRRSAEPELEEDANDDEEGDENIDDDPDVSWYRPPGLTMQVSGKPMLVLPLTCESLPELMKAMAYELDAWAKHLTTDKSCEGRLLFRINSTELPLNNAEKDKVAAFVQRCSEKARGAGMKSAQGKPIEMAVEYQESRYG
jgi:hypothetical protein